MSAATATMLLARNAYQGQFWRCIARLQPPTTYAQAAHNMEAEVTHTHTPYAVVEGGENGNLRLLIYAVCMIQAGLFSRDRNLYLIEAMFLIFYWK